MEILDWIGLVQRWHKKNYKKKNSMNLRLVHCQSLLGQFETMLKFWLAVEIIENFWVVSKLLTGNFFIINLICPRFLLWDLDASIFHLFFRHCNMVLENVQEMYCVPAIKGKGQKKSKSVEKSVNIPKLFLRGDSVILIVQNPSAPAPVWGSVPLAN